MACIVFVLPLPERRLAAKIVLLCRHGFAGAGRVGWNQGGCPPSRMVAGPSRGTLTDPTTMKKLLSSAVLALIVSAVVTAPSFAGCCFGLAYRHIGCCGCGAKFCVRQYNAFSPVCSGTVFCNGCCPFGPSCGYGGYGPGPYPGGMCPPGGCGVPFTGVAPCPTGCCGGGACLGSLPPSEPGLDAPVDPSTPGAAGPDPVATPAPLPAGPTSQAMRFSTLQNAAYRPTPAPTSRPTVAPRMQPRMMAAPSYWGD